MPIPKKGEGEKAFVSRCIPVVMREGASSTKHAAAKCHGIYRQWLKATRKGKG